MGQETPQGEYPMARKDVCNQENTVFYGPKQYSRCRSKGCFRDFSNQQPHDICACWPDGIVSRRGKPNPTVLSDGTSISGLTWKVRKGA
jgi:hypothetical protein